VNVLGGELEPCSVDPMTGYFRDGYCHTAGADLGFHVVCAVMTEEFLSFSVEAGNDLVTPQPQWMFPGLQPGDRWCVVAARWQEALEAGVAPPVVLEATHASALEFVSRRTQPERPQVIVAETASVSSIEAASQVPVTSSR
jgi:uncharacterized protein (DUF2237 family)